MPFQFSTDEEARFIQLTPAYINTFLDVEAFKIPEITSLPDDLTTHEPFDLMLLLKSIHKDGLITYFAKYSALGGDTKILADFLAYLLHKLTVSFPENGMTGYEFLCHISALLEIIQESGLDIERSPAFYQTKIDLLRLSILHDPIESIEKIDALFSNLDPESIHYLAQEIIKNHPGKATALLLKLEEKLQKTGCPNGVFKCLESHLIIDLFQCLNTVSSDSEQPMRIIETVRFLFRYMELHCALLPAQDIRRIKDLRDNPYLKIALIFTYNDADADKALREMPMEEKLWFAREAITHKQYHVVCSMARHISADDLSNEMARLQTIQRAMADHIIRAWARSPFYHQFYYQAAIVYRYLILLYSPLPPPYDEGMRTVLAHYPLNHLSQQQSKIYLITIASLLQPNFLDENRLFADFFPYFHTAFTEDLQKCLLTMMYEYRSTIFAASISLQNRPYLSLMSFMKITTLIEFALSEPVKDIAFLKLIESVLGAFLEDKSLDKITKTLINRFYVKLDSLLAEDIDNVSAATTQASGGEEKPQRMKHDPKSSSVLTSAPAPAPAPASTSSDETSDIRATPPSSTDVEEDSPPLTLISSSITSIAELKSSGIVTDSSNLFDHSQEEVIVERGAKRNALLRKQNATLHREILSLTTECTKRQHTISALQRSIKSMVADLKTARSNETALTSELTLHHTKIKEIIAVQQAQDALLTETKNALFSEQNTIQALREELLLANQTQEKLRLELSSIKESSAEPHPTHEALIKAHQHLTAKWHRSQEQIKKLRLELRAQKQVVAASKTYEVPSGDETATLRLALSAKEQEITTLHAQQTKSQEEARALRVTLRAKEQELTNLQKQHAQSRAQIPTLQSHLTIKSLAIHALQRQQTVLQQEVLELRGILHHQKQRELATLPPVPVTPMVPVPGYYAGRAGMLAVGAPPPPMRFFAQPMMPVPEYQRPPLSRELPRAAAAPELKWGREIIDPHCPDTAIDLMINYCFLSPGQDGVSYVLKIVRSEIKQDVSGRQHVVILPDSDVASVTTIHFDREVPPLNQILRLQCDEKGDNLGLFLLENNHEYKPILNAPLFIGGLLVTPSDTTSTASYLGV